ncbi:hypothetical protein FSB73_06405 [Arachidicoccus ginsenosidivorans]|uniref:Uncharacterized protein n=1 Tax=Arachidicoccus ginsenosidivorans TaxID=496057 RepID=A0A5B8VM80_9BACT|nr:hypothetical protein [Arachidicoccus ginsenosidivorans]QEC71358.1 hypothetical protein FSB73_06405 [Arachidicoccus ginsenosidivorans]
MCTEAYNTVGALIDVEDSLASSNAKSQANNGLSGIRKEKKSYQETTVLQIEGAVARKGGAWGEKLPFAMEEKQGAGTLGKVGSTTAKKETAGTAMSDTMF